MDVTPFSKLTILKQIGHGGFGDVYHARHRDWSEVAYKKLVVSFIRPTERSVVEMSLYWEFPWVPWVQWESHGNGNR